MSSTWIKYCQYVCARAHIEPFLWRIVSLVTWSIKRLMFCSVTCLRVETVNTLGSWIKIFWSSEFLTIYWKVFPHRHFKRSSCCRKVLIALWKPWGLLLENLKLSKQLNSKQTKELSLQSIHEFTDLELELPWIHESHGSDEKRNSKWLRTKTSLDSKILLRFTTLIKNNFYRSSKTPIQCKVFFFF